MNRRADLMENDAFRLSRVYAQGWAAGKKSLDQPSTGAGSAIANPGRDFEEKTRWAKGFEEALASRTGSLNVSRGSGWRPIRK